MLLQRIYNAIYIYIYCQDKRCAPRNCIQFARCNHSSWCEIFFSIKKKCGQISLYTVAKSAKHCILLIVINIHLSCCYCCCFFEKCMQFTRLQSDGRYIIVQQTQWHDAISHCSVDSFHRSGVVLHGLQDNTVRSLKLSWAEWIYILRNGDLLCYTARHTTIVMIHERKNENESAQLSWAEPITSWWLISPSIFFHWTHSTEWKLITNHHQFHPMCYSSPMYLIFTMKKKNKIKRWLIFCWSTQKCN